MIYLVGGPPRCGKTTAARRLAERLCCSRLPVDYLTTALMGYRGRRRLSCQVSIAV